MNRENIMEIPNLKTWKTALLLSIIVPVSLLTSFKLTGLIAEPQTIAETTTLEPIEWSFARPSAYSVFDKFLQAYYTCENAFGNFDLIVFDYVQNFSDELPAEVRMMTKINLTVNPEAFIESVSITFYDNQTLSKILFIELDFEFKNLSCTNLNYRYGSGMKAYLRAVGVNHPTNVFFSDIVIWKLFSPHDYAHLMKVTFEITYYNGTVFKKLVQPFQLCLRPDLQYVEVHAFTHNVRDNIIVDVIELSGVRVFIDDVEYFSPVSVVLPAKKHTITVEPTTYVNSTKYVLAGLLGPNGPVAKGNTLTVEAVSYSRIFATYQIE
ncbi:MAG: hypothetical protein K6T73_03125 [Candidatus Bathyarchaeota archaeon]|nr:hypothetical protein [Candidatus Bathyarchaeota archaeon]